MKRIAIVLIGVIVAIIESLQIFNAPWSHPSAQPGPSPSPTPSPGPKASATRTSDGP